jgi:hypothetical protein
MTRTTAARRAGAATLLATVTVLLAAGPAAAAAAPDDQQPRPAYTAPNKAQVERFERAMREPEPAQLPSTRPGDPSDPSSVPLTAVVLLGSAAVAGAVGLTVRRYRYRHHGPIGTATA